MNNIMDLRKQKQAGLLGDGAAVYGIYVENELAYVGSSLNCMKRKSVHLASLRGNKHGNAGLQDLYNTYGEDSFTFSAFLCTVGKEPEQLYYLEGKYINDYKDEIVNINSAPSKEKIIRTGKEKEEISARYREAQSGIKNPNSKLTEEQVLEIIELKTKGGLTQKEIAAMYGISQGQVSKIGRQRWKSVATLA